MADEEEGKNILYLYINIFHFFEKIGCNDQKF